MFYSEVKEISSTCCTSLILRILSGCSCDELQNLGTVLITEKFFWIVFVIFVAFRIAQNELRLRNWLIFQMSSKTDFWVRSIDHFPLLKISQTVDIRRHTGEQCRIGYKQSLQMRPLQTIDNACLKFNFRQHLRRVFHYRHFGVHADICCAVFTLASYSSSSFILTNDKSITCTRGCFI